MKRITTIILCSGTLLQFALAKERNQEPFYLKRNRKLYGGCRSNKVYGSTPAVSQSPKTFPFTCGDENSKAAAISAMVSFFGADAGNNLPMCEGDVCDDGQSCQPEGQYSSEPDWFKSGDDIDLEVDNSDPICGYKVSWTKENGSVELQPSNCECMDDDSDAGGGGEPHFFTWDKKWWSYHGGCDLVFLQTKLRDTEEKLLIHIRTTIHETFSYISEVSLSIGSSIFQVISNDKIQESCSQAKVRYILDGAENIMLPSKISAYPLTISQEKDKDNFFGCSKSTVFTIDLNAKEKIKISYLRGFLYVNVAASSLNFASATGLVGTWGKKGMVARDGKTVLDDPIAYAEEWQVRNDEPKLFKEHKYPQHPTKCLPPPSAEATERRRLSEDSSLRAMAEKACSTIENSMPKEMCMFDVMTMGDPNLASAPLYDAEHVRAD